MDATVTEDPMLNLEHEFLTAPPLLPEVSHQLEAVSAVNMSE
jgi:hypothetical protein